MPRIRSTAREDCDTKDFLSQPKKVLVTLICFICSFFSTARRTNQEAPPQLSGFWVRRYGRRRGLRNSLRSDSPRPFPSVFLATSPPDKGGIGGLACILTPSPFGHSPYIPCRNTPPCCGTRQGERRANSITFTEGILTPPSLRTPPLYFALQNAGEEGESNPPLIAVRYPAYGARQGRIVIQRTFFPSQR